MVSEPTGYAVSIGINDAPRLGRPLRAPEFIAEDFARLAGELGYQEVTRLPGAEATRGRLAATLADLASRARPGDIVLISFAGHGGRLLLDAPGDAEVVHECWHLFDGPWSDAELNAALDAFSSGVRVVVVSESCFAGGMARATAGAWTHRGGAGPSVRYLLAASEDAAAWASSRSGLFSRALLETFAAGEGLSSYPAFLEALGARFAQSAGPGIGRPILTGAGPALEEPAWGGPLAVHPGRPVRAVPLPADLLSPAQGAVGTAGAMTRFLGRMMQNEGGLLDRFVDPNLDAAERVGLLREAGLDGRAAGVVLREDAEAALGIVASEVLGWARARQVGAGAPGHQALWPGASLLASRVTPEEVPAGDAQELVVEGWHFPQRPEAFRVVFAAPDGQAIPAQVVEHAPVDTWGLWRAKVRFAPPVAGTYGIYLGDNDRGEVSFLASALRAVPAAGS